jgi:hypothetical protein
MPVTTYGRPRGSNTTPRVNDGYSGTSGGVNSGSLEVINGDGGGINRCLHCSGRTCTCDEGFIDGDLARTPLRPTSLFHKTPNDLQYKKKDSECSSDSNCYDGDNHLDFEKHNGDGLSGNSESLEWREVMTDILKYEENRISEKNL